MINDIKGNVLHPIVQNCFDVVKSNNTFIRKYGDEKFAMYEVCELGDKTAPLFVVDKYSCQYVLSFPNRKDMKFSSDKDSGFSGLKMVYDYAADKYKKQKERVSDAGYRSALSRINNMLIEQEKLKLQK